MNLELKQSDNFDTGIFILNEKKEPYSIFEGSSTLFLTQKNNLSLKKEILKLIEESKNVIKICSFLITDNDVYNALRKKVQNTSVAIFIITQLDQKKLKNISTLLNFLTEEELMDNSSQTHLNYIKSLFESGIHIRAAETIHAKFIISDRDKGFITSANITTPSLTLNTESGIYLDSRDSQELDKLFDIVYKSGTTYRQFISSNKKNKMFVVQSKNSIDGKQLPHIEGSGLRYTYEHISNNLYEKIIGIIENATEFIYLSTYSIVKLTMLPEFTSTIRASISRGVKIYIFCRGMNYRNDHLENTELLRSLGCLIYADIYNHSKGIINEDTGFIFTANIDGTHGLKSGFEVGYILNENQRRKFLKFHLYLIKTAFYEFMSRPTRSQLFGTYLKYAEEKKLIPPKFPSDITLTFDKGIRVNQKELKDQLLFYGTRGDTEYLICGYSYYQCKFDKDRFLVLANEEPRYDINKFILSFNKLKIILNP